MVYQNRKSNVWICWSIQVTVSLHMQQQLQAV